MTIKSPVLTTTTSLTAMAHPFIGTPGTPFEGGIVLGVNTITGQPEFFNPWAMKESGTLDAMLGLFLGQIKHGKSMAMKVLAIRLMMLTAGFQSMRTVINDYKPEGKESEYAAFSRVAQSVPFRIAEMQVNPLEERLFASKGDKAYELGILNMAKVITEFGKKQKLVGHEYTSLRIAVHMMLQYHPIFWELGLLAKMLRSLTPDQITSYYQTLDGKLKVQLEQRIATVAEFGSLSARTYDGGVTLKERLTQDVSTLVNAADNTNVADIQSAGDRVSSYLEGILHGSFGKMLGSKHSLYEMSTQRAVTKDWRGVDKEAETLMRIIDTSFKTSAIENHQLDLLPHLEIDDEQHKSMGNLIYAETKAFFGEITRGTHMCSLGASHRLASMRKGGVGSELYGYGNTVIDNLGFVGIGRQVNDKTALKELQERYGFTDVQRDNLPHLPKRVFAMKYAEAEPLRFIQVTATSSEIEMGQSESAIRRMRQRPNLGSQEDLEQYAKLNGYELADTPEA